ncbi:DUF1822 family protein [Chamaesiphon sp. OTE_20_metabat_361]|uniref:DUF1822 family protein n=1 Tax=Chamaesiphon sp. OTE_20_metabat_361 TaxID=2964689 RepID=UPI00286C9BD8|nr:DUF1822 family protein [Chamaesiphon sp. OTE_20_metabat_361]
MSIFDRQVQLLSEIYPEHVWIDITDLASASPLELSRYTIDKISNYLSDLGLVVKAAFPTEELYLPLISKAIDGFGLLIAGVRVAFIPSDSIDLAGFEIQQEWVDLNNWAADYYVPFQLVGVGDSLPSGTASRNENREHNYIHLWGFISHQSVQKKANLDRTLRTYEVDSADLIAELEQLWLSCELLNAGELTSERGSVCALAPLSASAATATIDRLQQHKSVFSPRLLLPFEEWGAIMNTPEYLYLYARPLPVITKISNWFRSQVESIDRVSNYINEGGWLTIDRIDWQPQLLPGFFHAHDLKDLFAFGNTILSTEQEIQRAVDNLYANQNPARKVDLPANVDSPLLLLTYLIQHTTDLTLCWQAVEYLWKIAPDNNQNWHRRIKDLGLVMQGHKLGLMVAAIPLLDGTYTILNRVYPIGTEACLPPNVQLNLFSESGERLYQVESRATAIDSYIQLYFTASVGNLFNVCISMNGTSITEAFII